MINLQTKRTLALWLKQSIQLRYSAKVCDYSGDSQQEWVNRKYWLTNIIFENYKRSPDDSFITFDDDFYCDINYSFYNFILFLQQARPITDRSETIIGKVQILFSLYFNYYLFIDSTQTLWSTNYFLFTHKDDFKINLVFDYKKFAKYLQVDFLIYIIEDFFLTVKNQIIWDLNYAKKHFISMKWQHLRMQ